MTSFAKFFVLCAIFKFGCCLELITVAESDVPELAYLNKSVDPCENFYEYSCGNFKNVKPIPDDEILWDHFTILQQEIHELARVIFQSPRKLEDPISLKKAKTMYGACINTNYEEGIDSAEAQISSKFGMWPILTDKPTREFSWTRIGDLVAEFGIPLFFNIIVSPSLFGATENIIYFQRDALSNPTTIRDNHDKNLEHYLKISDKRSTKALIPFEAFLNKIANRLRDKFGTFRKGEDIAAEISDLLNFMRTLQQGGIMDQKFNGTLMTIDQLQEWTDTHLGDVHGLNWLEFLAHVFGASGVKIKGDMVVYPMEINSFYGVLNLIKQTEPRMLENFVFTRLFTYAAPDSDKFMRDAFWTYYHDQGYTLYPRWEYCVRKILDYPGNVGLSFALTYEYQRYHFNINKLPGAWDMVKDLHAAFTDILNESDWIDETTLKSAMKKIENMITLLAFPDFVEDPKALDEFYQNLRICSWDHFGNSKRLRAFRLANSYSQMGLPRNRELWSMSPLEVNAYYNPINNRILFPISMLNSVFYNGEISALNYGRIGAVIGHEVTHGFDTSGMLYNEEGTYQMWWSMATLNQFKARTSCFKEQYANYYIEEIDSYVNSSGTLNENLADNGGLREAYKAFEKLQERKSALYTVEGYTPEQLFFVGFGTMWCMTETVDYLQYQHKTNKYSPGRYRVIGAVSNMKQFADAFGCPVGSAMNPENKCILW